MTKSQVVIIDYQDLLPSDSTSSSPSSSSSSLLAQHMEDAFGPHGLGIIGIRNVPGLVQAKAQLFPMAYTLAHLPHDYLEEHLTDAASLYNVGWSRGKELLNGGQPDHAKGSFYYCPISDTPGTLEERKQYPLSYPVNKWPSSVEDDDDEEGPAVALSGFQPAAKQLGVLLQEVVLLVARHLDSFCEQRVANYASNTLYHALHDAPKVKARLLYYYPPNNNNNKKEETEKQQRDDTADAAPWIGWHNDSGFLTALAGDLYVDDRTGDILDPELPLRHGAGLYVATTTSSTKGTIQEHHIVLPPDCMAVQIGECTQIISGGALVATPHAVKSVTVSPTISDAITAETLSSHVARISLACFVDTPPSYPLSPPPGCTREEVVQASHPDPRVPPLSQRWTRNDMAFGDFLRDTFAMYYQWQQQPQQQLPPTESNNQMES